MQCLACACACIEGACCDGEGRTFGTAHTNERVRTSGLPRGERRAKRQHARASVHVHALEVGKRSGKEKRMKTKYRLGGVGRGELLHLLSFKTRLGSSEASGRPREYSYE